MIKNKTLTLLGLGLTFLISHFTIKAQETDTLKPARLNEVVVSATRSEKQLSETGRSVSIIDADAIKNAGLTTVAELLSQHEGIYVVGNGQNPGQTQNVFVRGANPNQTLIMIDGMRIPDVTGPDNAVDLAELSLVNVERIEIVRGSHSTLYGSSAIGGIINIITKKNSTPGFHTDIGLSVGTFGARTLVLAQNAFGNFTFRNGLYANAEVFNVNTNGIDATTDTVTDATNYQHMHRDRDGFDHRDIAGKIGYNRGRLDVFGCYKNVHQRIDLDKAAYQDDDNYVLNFDRQLYSYGVSYKISKKLQASFTGGLTKLNRKLVDDSSLVDEMGTYDHTYSRGIYTGTISSNEVQVNYGGRYHSIVAGSGLQYEKMTFNTHYFSGGASVFESQRSLDTLGINVKTINQYVHVDLNGGLIASALDAVSLGLGARNTIHDIFGNNITYAVNPSVRIAHNSLLYTSYSTGFNSPSLYQMYAPDKNSVSGVTRGNKNLKPETSSSFEVGLKQRINANTSFNIAFFISEVKNSVEYAYLWDRIKPVDSLSFNDYHGDTYINTGKQINKGIEIGLQSQLANKLTLSANISVLSGELFNRPADIDPTLIQNNYVQLFRSGAFIENDTRIVGLIRRPNTANIALGYKVYKHLLLATNMRYVSPRSDIYYDAAIGPFGALSTNNVGSYALLDISANWKIYKGLSAVLRVTNVLNEHYSEINGYATRGRGGYVTIKYSM